MLLDLVELDATDRVTGTGPAPRLHRVTPFVVPDVNDGGGRRGGKELVTGVMIDAGVRVAALQVRQGLRGRV